VTLVLKLASDCSSCKMLERLQAAWSAKSLRSRSLKQNLILCDKEFMVQSQTQSVVQPCRSDWQPSCRRSLTAPRTRALSRKALTNACMLSELLYDDLQLPDA
jgi:hypothetical protein